MPRSHLAQPPLSHDGKSNQGGLPKEVRMEKEQIYTHSIQVTKLLLSAHQCEAPHQVPGCRGGVFRVQRQSSVHYNEAQAPSFHCPS